MVDLSERETELGGERGKIVQTQSRAKSGLKVRGELQNSQVRTAENLYWRVFGRCEHASEDFPDRRPY